MPLGSVITGSAGTALINSTVKLSIDLLFDKIKKIKWRHGSDAGRKIYESIIGKDEYYLKYIESCVEKNLFSYTLLDPENKTSVSTTYYPIKIKKKSTKENQQEEIIIDDRFYISDAEITNISGTAGQGKSTLLRKILINQIEYGDKIPFFLNLSTIKDETILNEVLYLIERIGVPCSLESVKSLFSSGRVVLFLDGFDEIQTAKRELLLQEIISINENFKTQIITSSRPETIICDTAGIKQFKIKDLQLNDVIGIIKRAGSYIDVEAVEKSLAANKKFSSSLKTPILVILFIKCFPFMKIIPNDTIEFYKSIFDVMYETHDKIKRFLGRDKIVKKISRSESYDYFCAFCFVTLFEEITSMDERKMAEKAYEAMELINPETENNQKYRDLSKNILIDIKDITSLLIKDTDYTYTFPHKSIQEYHAAEFIKMQPSSNNAKEKYCSIISEKIKTTEHMHDFIEFLVKIDKIDAINYILEPYLYKLGVNFNEHEFKVHDDAINDLIEKDFGDSFVVFIPKGLKGIKYNDDFILAAGRHSKKHGRVIVGPAQEILYMLNAFSQDLNGSYSDKIIDIIAMAQETILDLFKMKTEHKIPFNEHLKKLPEVYNNKIIEVYRDKISYFYYNFYLKEKKTPLDKKPSFLERYKLN